MDKKKPAKKQPARKKPAARKKRPTMTTAWREKAAKVAEEFHKEQEAQEAKEQPPPPPPPPEPVYPMAVWQPPEVRAEWDYRSDPRTAYLWRDNHAKYVTAPERQARIRAIEDCWKLIPKEGFIAEYVKHWLPTTDAPVLFHVAGALTCAASILHQRVWMRQGGDRVVPMLWSVMLGMSTTMRKSTCSKAVASTLPLTSMSILLPQSFTFVQLLVKMGVIEANEADLKRAMRERQAMLAAVPGTQEGVGLLLLDEYTTLLAALDKEYNRQIEELFHAFYEGRGWVHVTKTQGCTGVPEGGAHLNILGATTPEWLGRVAKQRHIHEGFFPRYMFFYCDAQDYTLPVRDNPAPSELGPETKWLVALDGGERPLSPQAADFYAGWYRSFIANRDPEMAVWSQRLSVNALKVSLVYEACTDNAPEVSLANLQLACRLIERIATDTTRLLEGDLAFGERDSLVKNVRRVVRTAGQIAWRDISRKLHRHSRSSLKSALDTLIQQGVIVAGQGPQGGEQYTWVDG